MWTKVVRAVTCCGLAVNMIKEWLGLLETSFLIFVSVYWWRIVTNTRLIREKHHDSGTGGTARDRRSIWWNKRVAPSASGKPRLVRPLARIFSGTWNRLGIWPAGLNRWVCFFGGDQRATPAEAGIALPVCPGQLGLHPGFPSAGQSRPNGVRLHAVLRSKQP